MKKRGALALYQQMLLLQSPLLYAPFILGQLSVQYLLAAKTNSSVSTNKEIDFSMPFH